MEVNVRIRSFSNVQVNSADTPPPTSSYADLCHVARTWDLHRFLLRCVIPKSSFAERVVQKPLPVLQPSLAAILVGRC